MNKLYYGDNLQILPQYVAPESVDLVYLDPPFNSNANYNILFEESPGVSAASQITAFDDTWHWSVEESERLYYEVLNQGGNLSEVVKALRTFLGENDMMAYLVRMAATLRQLHTAMKPTATIYLHCDPTASHYLKLLMDAMFGPKNFRNEVIWKRTNSRSTSGRWPRVHDVLLFYSKSDSFYYETLKVKADEGKLPHTLITVGGVKYQTFELTAPGATQEGDSGKPWKGFDPNKYGRHWGNSEAERNAWDAAGLIHWPKKGKSGGWPRRRDEEPFDIDNREVTVGDVWTDIDRINQSAKERLGYPTQKPEALLERVLEASSKPGDLVLDPFCGCGTTIAVAEGMQRRWIGIDVTNLAITLIRHRLRTSYPSSNIEATYQVVGEPVSVPDAEALAKQDAFQFQWWALGLVGARPVEQKKGADKGIDGRIYFFDGENRQIILSVKSGHLKATDVRDLRGVLDREKADIGVLISLADPSGLMKKEASSAGFYKSPWGMHPKMQLLTVEQLLAGAKIDFPASQQTNLTFKKAPAAKVKGAIAQKINFDEPAD